MDEANPGPRLLETTASAQQEPEPVCIMPWRGVTIDAPFQRFSLGASMFPGPSFVWMSSIVCTLSWLESVGEGGVSGGGRGLDVGLLGRRGCGSSGGRRRASVTWRGVRGEGER